MRGPVTQNTNRKPVYSSEGLRLLRREHPEIPRAVFPIVLQHVHFTIIRLYLEIFRFRPFRISRPLVPVVNNCRHFQSSALVPKTTGILSLSITGMCFHFNRCEIHEYHHVVQLPLRGCTVSVQIIFRLIYTICLSKQNKYETGLLNRATSGANIVILNIYDVP